MKVIIVANTIYKFNFKMSNGFSCTIYSFVCADMFDELLTYHMKELIYEAELALLWYFIANVIF